MKIQTVKRPQLAKKSRRGQGMTEYIIIVALIAIAAIGVVTVFGDNIRKLFGVSAEALGGAGNQTTNGVKDTGAKKGAKKLDNFGSNNY